MQKDMSAYLLEAESMYILGQIYRPDLQIYSITSE